MADSQMTQNTTTAGGTSDSSSDVNSTQVPKHYNDLTPMSIAVLIRIMVIPTLVMRVTVQIVVMGLDNDLLVQRGELAN